MHSIDKTLSPYLQYIFPFEKFVKKILKVKKVVGE